MFDPIRPASPRVTAGADRADKVQQCLDDFFNRKKPATSFREAYIDITGDTRVTGRLMDCDPQRLREASGISFREAIDSTVFTKLLGDAVNRALIREYNEAEAFFDWRWLVDIVPVSDFRKQHRVRLGGYGNLPTVNENAAYTALGSPSDEEATYAVKKYGGTETLSLEAIANDDVGLIRRIPVALGQAANRTLYEFVYGFIGANAAIYDTKSLFHADHANIGTVALNAGSFSAARLALLRQTEKDSGSPLGLRLAHLIVPPNLQETAFDLFRRGTNLDPTFVQAANPTIHVAAHWTDSNNWYATADKLQTPLIEMGFHGGTDPQVFAQDMPTQGSLFANDQMKFKIRHVYSGAVLDWRGFYGALVA